MTDLQQKIQAAQVLISGINSFRVCGMTTNETRPLEPIEMAAYHAALELMRNYFVGETVEDPPVEEIVP